MHPGFRGTLVFLACLALAGITLSWPESSPVAMAARVAWITGAGLLLAVLTEVPGGDPRSWFRIDWAALAATYYLTLFEFLFPQPLFDTQARPEATIEALVLVLHGFAALALGRHFLPPPARVHPAPPLSRNALLVLLAVCFGLGHLHLFASVGFHPVRLAEELLRPRFSQPWARERLGDHRALLSELRLLAYLVPPITGWLLVREIRHPGAKALLVLPLAFLLIVAFCSGTRYVLATHLATLAASLAWSAERLPWRRVVLLAGLPVAILLVVTTAALQFRQSGLEKGLSDAPRRLIVDNNLRTIARLTEAFPETHPHLGLEIPYHILVRPVPRVLFPAKPVKLSHSMEDVIGIPGTTIASTYIGEGFLMAGLGGTILFGFALGLLCAAWNRLPVAPASATAVILYASGFHWALLAARSPIWLSVGLLPCLAFWLATRFLTKCFPHSPEPSVPRPGRTTRRDGKGPG